MPNEEIAVEMYELMLDRLAAAGYAQYEISNFTRPGHKSIHNSKYWTLDPVFGFGVSAHSFDGRQRFANERDTAKYVALIEQNDSAEVMRETIDFASEFAFLGLRMEDGVDLSDYLSRFNVDLLRKYSADLAYLDGAGLTQISDGRLQLTRRGKLFSNDVFSVFV